MRALDNCQNLVIRNKLSEILTIYVNKEKGYAVFNDVLGKIYNVFLRGVSTFLKTYHTNTMKRPITGINVGENENTILSYSTNNKHPNIDIQQALQYGSYSLSGSGYRGDWTSKQRLVLKR